MNNKHYCWISLAFCILIIFIFSPWTPSIRKPSTKEYEIVNILAERKEFADQIIQDYSRLPKKRTEEIRALYKDAQLKINPVIELFGYSADNNFIPIDRISKTLSDADVTYKKLHKHVITLRDKKKKFQILAEDFRSSFDSPSSDHNLPSEGETGALVRAFNDIAGQREIYERLSKRIEKYRWDPFIEVR